MVLSSDKAIYVSPRNGAEEWESSIVLKFVVIQSTGDYTDQLIVSVITQKHVITQEEFDGEAMIQDRIYTETLSPQGTPVSAGIIALHYFTPESLAGKPQGSSKPVSRRRSISQLSTIREHTGFTNFANLLSHACEDEQTLVFLNFLLDQSNIRTIGLLVMEHIKLNVVASHQLSALPRSTSYSQRTMAVESHTKSLRPIALNVLAQMIYIFIKFKYILYDSHTNNIMSNFKEASVLIDFGRVFLCKDDALNVDIADGPLKDMREGVNCSYARVSRSDWNTDYCKIKCVVLNESFDESIVESILKFIVFMDFSLNSELFNRIHPQCHRILDIAFGIVQIQCVSDIYRISSRNWETTYYPPFHQFNAAVLSVYTELKDIVLGFGIAVEEVITPDNVAAYKKSNRWYNGKSVLTMKHHYDWVVPSQNPLHSPSSLAIDENEDAPLIPNKDNQSVSTIPLMTQEIVKDLEGISFATRVGMVCDCLLKSVRSCFKKRGGKRTLKHKKRVSFHKRSRYGT